MARRAASKEDRQVRLSFQLFASDNALLVGDLLNHRKGKLRHTRLVTLATLGLMLEQQTVVGAKLLISHIGQPAATAARGDPAPLSLTAEDLELVDCLGKGEGARKAGRAGNSDPD